VVICMQRGAVCLHMVQLMPLLPETPSSLASFKSRLVLPFWYRLTQIVLENRPFNGCSCSDSYGRSIYCKQVVQLITGTLQRKTEKHNVV